MKKLAYWSKRNPIPARIIIALCHLVLISLGIFSGIATYVEDIKIPLGMIYLMASTFSLAYIFYPQRGDTDGLLKYSWNRRVKHDIILVLSYTCILTSGINHWAFKPLDLQESQPQVRLMMVNSGADTRPMTKKEIRKDLVMTIKAYKAEIKEQFKSLKTEWKEKKDELLPLKIVLILFVIGLALAAAYGIGALSCELSCSGQEGLAVAVGVFGTIAIILLLIIAIRGIVRMGRKGEANEKPQNKVRAYASRRTQKTDTPDLAIEPD